MLQTIRPLALAAVAGVAIAAGCTHQTEGDRTLEKAERVEDAGLIIKRGEQMRIDGAATEARGRETKRLGKDLEGDKLINEGQAMQKQGDDLISRGRDMQK